MKECYHHYPKLSLCEEEPVGFRGEMPFNFIYGWFLMVIMYVCPKSMIKFETGKIAGKTEMNGIIETKRKEFQEGANNLKSFKKLYEIKARKKCPCQ